MINQVYTEALINTLISSGIEDICLAPGSRSTALAIASAENQAITKHVHFDERALIFLALGIAKAKKKAVAVLVTSGTACGNLLPAIMEAHHDKIPLIIMTADRPFELRYSGANQTSDQARMFQNFVRASFDFACPEEAVSLGNYCKLFAHAIHCATRSPQGPVHCNIMQREPFFPWDSNQAPSLTTPCRWQQGITHPNFKLVEQWANVLEQEKDGIILVGGNPGADHEILKTLSDKLGYPIIADVLSSRRSQDCLQFSSLIIQHMRPHIRAILHIGDRIVSKEVLKYIEEQDLHFFAHVADHPFREDPLSRHTDCYEGNPQIFLETLANALEVNRDLPSMWQTLEINPFTVLSELALAQTLAQTITSDHFIFFGNSMPIRDADLLFFPQEPIEAFGLRGLSGIDGNLATIAGLALGLKKKGIAIIGDQTFLYDLTSLSLIAKSPYPITLIVINNHGGGIFSFLPVSQRRDVLGPYFTTSQHYNLEHSANLFGIDYYKIKTLSECFSLLQDNSNSSRLVEIEVDIEQNVQEHRDFHATIRKNCLQSMGMPL